MLDREQRRRGTARHTICRVEVNDVMLRRARGDRQRVRDLLARVTISAATLCVP